MKRIFFVVLLAFVLLAGCKKDVRVETSDLSQASPACMQAEHSRSLDLCKSEYFNTTLTLDSQAPYWGMYVENKGDDYIRVDTGGGIVQVDAKTSLWIYNQEPCAGENRIGFCTNSGKKMEGTVDIWFASTAEQLTPSVE